MPVEASVSVLVRLLLAHILADFFMQTSRSINDKAKRSIRSPSFYGHITVVGVMTWLLLADWTEWRIPLFIAFTHFLIDWWKSHKKETLVTFSIDQLAHLLMIVVAWGWYTGITSVSISLSDATPTLVVITGFAVALRPSGFFIANATRRWKKQMATPDYSTRGLPDAGTWIGYLERIIILILVMIGQFSAIGFLIAAKSVFRFSGSMKNKRDRREAEYILIGTLLSFTAAILIGFGMVYLLDMV